MNGGGGNESNRQDHQDRGSGAGATPGAPGDAQGAAGGAGQSAVAIPDVAGPLTGWRTWRLTAEGRLASVNDGLVWPPKQAMTAVCHAALATAFKKHQIPDPDCTCGVYAYKDRSHSGVAPGVMGVVGEVALWGRVVIAELGYRAEFGYPARLIGSALLPVGAVEALKAAYGVPVEIEPLPLAGIQAPPSWTSVPLAPSVNPANLQTAPPSWTPGATPPHVVAARIRTQYMWWTMEANPQPNLVYRWRLPSMGVMYATIELSPSAEGIVDRAQVVLNGAFPIVDAPLAVLARTGPGNFLLYDGFRMLATQPVCLDTRAVSILEVTATMRGFTPPAPPILIGALTVMSR